MASGKQSLNTALSLIEPIRKTVELGVQPISTGDNRQGIPSCFLNDSFELNCFSSHIHFELVLDLICVHQTVNS